MKPERAIRYPTVAHCRPKYTIETLNPSPNAMIAERATACSWAASAAGAFWADLRIATIPRSRTVSPAPTVIPMIPQAAANDARFLLTGLSSW